MAKNLPILNVSGYKINMQKSVLFLHITNKLSVKEIHKIIPFLIASKTIIYLKIHLTKIGKDLYTENQKILMK